MLTVVTPTYKVYPQRTGGFAQAAKSLLAQTNIEFQWLIIQDGPDQADYEYLSTYEDPRISIYRTHHHAGPWDCLNHGIAKAKYDYITFLDQDDYYEPDALSTLYRAIHLQEAYLATAQVYSLTSGKKRLRGKSPTIIMNNFISHDKIEAGTHLGSTIWRKKFLEHLGGFIDQWGYDSDLLIKAILYLNHLKEPIPHILEPLYTWNRNTGSYSTNPDFNNKIERLKASIMANKEQILQAPNHEELATLLKLKNYFTITNTANPLIDPQPAAKPKQAKGYI